MRLYRLNYNLFSPNLFQDKNTGSLTAPIKQMSEVWGQWQEDFFPTNGYLYTSTIMSHSVSYAVMSPQQSWWTAAQTVKSYKRKERLNGFFSASIIPDLLPIITKQHDAKCQRDNDTSNQSAAFDFVRLIWPTVQAVTYRESKAFVNRLLEPFAALSSLQMSLTPDQPTIGDMCEKSALLALVSAFFGTYPRVASFNSILGTPYKPITTFYQRHWQIFRPNNPIRISFVQTFLNSTCFLLGQQLFDEDTTAVLMAFASRRGTIGFTHLALQKKGLPIRSMPLSLQCLGLFWEYSRERYYIKYCYKSREFVERYISNPLLKIFANGAISGAAGFVTGGFHIASVLTYTKASGVGIHEFIKSYQDLIGMLKSLGYRGISVGATFLALSCIEAILERLLPMEEQQPLQPKAKVKSFYEIYNSTPSLGLFHLIQLARKQQPKTTRDVDIFGPPLLVYAAGG